MEERRGGEGGEEENFMLATYPPFLAKRTVDWSLNTCVSVFVCVSAHTGCVKCPSRGNQATNNRCVFPSTLIHYWNETPTILQYLYKYLFYSHLTLSLNLPVRALPVDIQQHKGIFIGYISQSKCWVETIECQNNGDSSVTSRFRYRLGKRFVLVPKPSDECDSCTDHCLRLCLHYQRQFIMCWWHPAGFSAAFPVIDL